MATTGLLVLALAPAPASAASTPIGLGTVTSYAVLAGSTVTNTGPSVINGDRGLSPGTAVTGFPPGTLNGTSHTADAEALQAQGDLTVAYGAAAGATPATSVATELGGITFTPGTYVGATLGLTGTVTLDAEGDPDAVFLFKTSSTLVTASNSAVVLIGSADPCNVYWQVSSSATLGTDTDFVGTVMAQASITANTGADVEGRLLARTGAVTLDTNVITRPTCAVLPPGTTTTTTAPTSTTSTTGSTSTTSTTGSTSTTSTTVPPVATSQPGPSAPIVTATPEGTVPGDSSVDGQVPGPGAPGGPSNPGGGSDGGDARPPGTTTDTLVRTGTNTLRLTLGGLLLLAAGGILLAGRRRLLLRR